MLIIFQKKCVELKSLKNYMWSFRDVGAFHEKVTNDIHENLKNCFHQVLLGFPPISLLEVVFQQR